MSDIDSTLIAAFREEVPEFLDELGLCLERLRSGSGNIDTSIQTAFRVAHNIKGAAQIVGLAEVATLAHKLEDKLQEARDQKAKFSPEGVETMLLALTHLRESIEGASHGHAEAQLLAWMAEIKTIPRAPADEEVEDLDAINGPMESLGPTEGSVRVDRGRLDDLMATVGEMMVVQAGYALHHKDLESFNEHLSELDESKASLDSAAVGQLSRSVDALTRASQQKLRRLELLTDSISTALKRLRILPLAGLAPQWRRTVLEAAQQLGREASLQIEVGTIELDKVVVEGLREPLMHLLRNAVVHGIEDVDERLARGKMPAGQVQLRASLKGRRVVLEVSDDGRGFELERIAKVAISRGWIAPERAQEMSPRELREMVFKSGFSTTTEVTPLSGRGVGLDVVDSQLRELGGSIEISAPTLGGASFLLSVPVTLLSTRGLLVRAGTTVFAIPVDFVQRVCSIPRDKVRQIEGGQVVLLDDAPISLTHLSQLMSRAQPDMGELTLVIVELRGTKVAISVSEVLGEEEFVTRPLPWNLEYLPGVSGAILLGDGNIALVADVPDLLEVLEGGQTLVAAKAKPLAASQILVVDDSLTSRTLAQNTLTAAGYQVDVAADGAIAWNMLKSQPSAYALLVSDVQMPFLDGFGLTAKVRAHSELSSLPVILVTSLNDANDIARGAEVGADEYIVKGKVSQEKLLEAVSRILGS